MMQMDGSIAESVREEAGRAKAIAVEKYEACDFVGAKEFAVKTKSLDPKLCGLLRPNAVLDVRTAFVKKIYGGLTDWYAVLAVDPSNGKRKQSCDRSRKLHLILQTGEDGGRRDRLKITPNIIGSASQHNNVGVAEETITLQDSNTSDVFNEDEPNIMVSVQDRAFYNFNKDRVESSFGENQVWAAYDDDEMPRLYALVHSVMSQDPSKVRISWLIWKDDGELSSMRWIDSGFLKTSGCFSISERSNIESLSSFSHRVKWTKHAQGVFHIYPSKGDVWAAYRNWRPNWDSSTPEEAVNEYEIYEVVEDFNEEVGVMVLRLVKVPGFKNIFRRGPNMWTFSLKYLHKFSHQVVYRILTGQEGENALEGCFELDPAALSQVLLQVLTQEEIEELDEYYYDY